MVCNAIGISTEKAFRNSVAYLQSWIDALKSDKRMIVWAAGRAEKAVRYMFGEVTEKEVEE
jgi:antirestriction protein ArdC